MTFRNRRKFNSKIKTVLMYFAFIIFFLIFFAIISDLVLQVDKNEFQNHIKDVIDKSILNREENSKILCYSSKDEVLGIKEINYYILFDEKGNILKVQASNEKYYYSSAIAKKDKKGAYIAISPVTKDDIEKDGIQKIKGRYVEECK